jgi:5-carboxymethyl-2-hydroxymuconate isomerase
MPHVIVEYSANLDDRIGIVDLIRDVHETVLGTGVFEIGAVRTRAERRDVFRIADGDASHAFIHVEVRIGPGRDAETRKRLAQAIMDTIGAATREVFARSGLALSVEVREIDNTATLRVNNLHDRMAAKGHARRVAS